MVHAMYLQMLRMNFHYDIHELIFADPHAKSYSLFCEVMDSLHEARGTALV